MLSHMWNFKILYKWIYLQNKNRLMYTRVPHPEPSSLLPPRTIPLGRLSAPAPSIQYSASNLDWWLDAWYRMLGAGALRRPRGMVWGGRRVLDGEHEYVYLWWIHVDIWQNQYNIVKLKNKIKKKRKEKQSEALFGRDSAMWPWLTRWPSTSV